MKILVVVDMQNDFIFGALGSDAAMRTVMPVREKIFQAQENGIPIFVTMDTHNEDYLTTLEGTKLPIKHCIRNSEGWHMHPVIYEALTRGQYHRVLKNTFGYTYFPVDILRALELPAGRYDKIQEIEVCGLCTDICVMNNVAILRAAFPNATITVDSNACAGTSPEAHNAALLVMKSLQVDVI